MEVQAVRDYAALIGALCIIGIFILIYAYPLVDAFLGYFRDDQA